jgi:hypothetical protein
VVFAGRNEISVRAEKGMKATLQSSQTKIEDVPNAPNVIEALREHAAPEYVISHGKLIDKTKMEKIIST